MNLGVAFREEAAVRLEDPDGSVRIQPFRIVQIVKGDVSHGRR